MEFFDKIIESLQFGYMQKAMVAGSFIALGCSLLGVFLVLKRLSLIGDGLSHVSLATIAIGMLLGIAPLYASIPLVMLASLWILKLESSSGMFGDAAIGIVASIGIALGVLIASLAGGFNVDLFSYLFGSILAIKDAEMYMAISISLVVLILTIVYYHDLFAITYDEDYAKASGVNTRAIYRLLVLLTSVTVVLGIRVVGTMLVSSLIVFPAVTALLIAKSFKQALFLSARIGVVSVLLGIIISYPLNIPTGATIVLCNFIIFIIVFIIRRLQ